MISLINYRFVFSLLISLAVSPLFATTWHVKTNGNDATGLGTVAKPWASLAQAVKQVKANQNDTIKLGEGTFNANLKDTSITLGENISLIGSGKSKTIYIGNINAPKCKNQVFADFMLDGRMNTEAKNKIFEGLKIDTANNIEIRDLRIEGFWSNGLVLGKWSPGVTNSVMHHCELVNNGVATSRGFGMRSGDLTNVTLHHLIFIEEEGKGGEIWNTGLRKFTNLKMHDCIFKAHADKTAGWNGQVIFDFEWFRVDALNVEVFNCQFDGTLSLVSPQSGERQNKKPYSVRLHHNVWKNTTRMAVEAAMTNLVIDSNYIHMGGTDYKPVGTEKARIGPYAIASFGAPSDYLQLHHNIIENILLEAIHGLKGKNISILNNTVIAAPPQNVPGFWKENTVSFIKGGAPDSSGGWLIQNNIFVNPDTSRKAFFLALGENLVGAKVSHNAIYQADSSNVNLSTNQYSIKPLYRFNPQFTESEEKESTWYHLKIGSPAIDKGIKIPGITDSSKGIAPDLGAVETLIATGISLHKNYIERPANLNSWVINNRLFDLKGRVKL